MTKSALLKALSVIPEDADISVEFTTADYYKNTYKGQFSGINLNINQNDIFTVVLQVTEVPEPEATETEAAPF